MRKHRTPWVPCFCVSERQSRQGTVPCLLTQIVRGDGMKYVLAYNAYHNLESIGVDGEDEKLVQYTYKTGNGRLKGITYANGDRMAVTYNSAGQMTGEKWFDKDETLTAHYKYVYDGQGNIVRSLDMLARKEYTYSYEDGRITRAAECDIALDGNEIVAAKTLVNTIFYVYDGEGTLIRKRILPAGGEERVIYYETTEDNTTVKFRAGGRDVTSHSKTDSFGRKVFDELQLGTSFVSRQFSYHAGDVTEAHTENGKLRSSPTTQLVSQIVLSDGRTLSYEYDAEERITKVTDSFEGVTEYTYDALGQLQTETVNGEVVNEMVYDNYGNILQKNGIRYTYSEGWNDRLAFYDNEQITYDAQGNPLNYLGHTLTWEKGRQLKSFGDISFTYNANGIRTSKTVDGIRHNYLLDGVNILRETWNNNVLETLYDNEDTVCGIIYNGDPYYFHKNLQGDIIAIADEDGKVVARYTYDAWGKCEISVHSTDASIAEINPYRYRGYYFDTETGFYYLRSRYYDPNVGRFLSSDTIESIVATYDVLEVNLYSYCENNSVNNFDSNGAISWSKILSVFNRLGEKAKSILEQLIDGASRLLGVKANLRWKDISKIAKDVKRSPHRVKQCFNWIADKVDKLKTKVGKIFKALSYILFVTSIIESLKQATSFVKEIATKLFKKIAEGLSALLSWCVSKGIKFISKFIPALGGVAGYLLGEVIGIFLDNYFENRAERIACKYASKVNIYTFKPKDYIFTFFKCLG